MAGASDLAPVQADLEAEFRRATGGQVRFTLGSSGMLAQQILHGAPYDVFLSADERRVRELTAAGKLEPDSVLIYALGKLALWSKSGQYRSVHDLARSGMRHLSLANPAHAPYGVAARQALERAGLWERLKERVVYGESVRQASEYAFGGNADATLTAWSLVYSKGGVLVPEEFYEPVRQSGGVVRGCAHAGKAWAFLKVLAGPEGQAILARSGFGRAR